MALKNKFRILVVEDNELFNRMLTSQLTVGIDSMGSVSVLFFALSAGCYSVSFAVKWLSKNTEIAENSEIIHANNLLTG